MILKLGLKHQGLKLYKVYIIDDPELTMTYSTSEWTDFHEYVTSGTKAPHSLFKFCNLGFSIGKKGKQWIFQNLLPPVTRKFVDTDNYLSK